MLNREFDLSNLIKKQRVTIIYGPRRVGKTTLLKSFLSNYPLKYKLDSGDNITTRHIFDSNRFEDLLDYVSGYDLLAIDEAQQIENIGMGLKILVDQKPDLSIIVTGSSSFSIKQNLGEPLTGRKREIVLFPFSQRELLAKYNKFELKEKLDDFLIFGSYPEVALTTNVNEKIELLNELVNSYLLKDILTIDRIRGSRQLLDLLKLLAFQVGNEVSINELATQVHLDTKTVQKYIDLLEKSFVIQRLTPFNRNLRKEISKKNKYYFLDNGIRNGVILQFNKLKDRNDYGQLFENFMVIERLKRNSNSRIFLNSYFWRTFDKKEIDLIEERDGLLSAFEFKWNSNKKYLAPKDWSASYPGSSFEIISQDNYFDFIL
ncbi:MAG: ATP-binding protein [Ignavibacteriaceae bacterium]